MSKDYSSLNASEKRQVSQVINLKHKLVELNAEFNDKNAKVFALVESYGGITKGKDTIVYNAKGDDGMTFDLERFAKENPDLYAKYYTKPTKGKKAYLSYRLS